ncbi:hypothetical protein B566_EDAN010456, partial [Ephemera danica]
MADKDRRNDEECSNFRRRKQSDVDDNSSDDMDATSDSPSGPDIGLGHTHRRGGEQKFGDSSSSATDNPTVQSLPDFLSDGPIQCRESDQGLPGPEIVEQDRGDEGQLRRNLAEMSRRCEALETLGEGSDSRTPRVARELMAAATQAELSL